MQARSGGRKQVQASAGVQAREKRCLIVFFLSWCGSLGYYSCASDKESGSLRVIVARQGADLLGSVVCEIGGGPEAHRACAGLQSLRNSPCRPALAVAHAVAQAVALAIPGALRPGRP